MRLHSVHSAMLCAAVLALATPADAVTFSATGSGGAIPDNNQAGISSTITVPVAVGSLFEIQNLSLTISGLTHTWVGDLVITLTRNGPGPGPNTTVDIINRLGASSSSSFGDSSNLDGTYIFSDNTTNSLLSAAQSGGSSFVIPAGSYFASTGPTNTTVPSGTNQSFLSAFYGQRAFGEWTLLIRDLAGGDVGSFSSWTLTLDSEPIPEPTSVPALLSLAAVGGYLARRRRQLR